MLPRPLGVRAGTAYLAGLLHDAGFLVLGQLFTSEYFWLNKLIASKPDVPVTVIEHQLLGIHHTDLGERLMKRWLIPAEICAAVAHHHDIDYEGPYADYVAVVLLADRLLKAHNLSDASSEDVPPVLLARLGLSEEQAYTAVDEMIQGSEAIEAIACALCA
jgi:HD-like signal output (HDOD) protein